MSAAAAVASAPAQPQDASAQFGASLGDQLGSLLAQQSGSKGGKIKGGAEQVTAAMREAAIKRAAEEPRVGWINVFTKDSQLVLLSTE